MNIEFTLVESGGPVMWLLLVLAVAGLLFFIERVFYLHKGQIKAASFVDGVGNLLAKGSLLEALTVCEETPGPVARVVKAALMRYREDEGAIRQAMQSAAVVEVPFLERRIGTVGMIAKIAPMLGLMGTVLSCFHIFMQLETEGNYAQVSPYSGYIVAALTTTVMGLLISILAYFAFHFLKGRVRAIIFDMEWAASEMLNLIYENKKGGQFGDSSEVAISK